MSWFLAGQLCFLLAKKLEEAYGQHLRRLTWDSLVGAGRIGSFRFISTPLSTPFRTLSWRRHFQPFLLLPPSNFMEQTAKSFQFWFVFIELVDLVYKIEGNAQFEAGKPKWWFWQFFLSNFSQSGSWNILTMPYIYLYWTLKWIKTLSALYCKLFSSKYRLLLRWEHLLPCLPMHVGLVSLVSSSSTLRWSRRLSRVRDNDGKAFNRLPRSGQINKWSASTSCTRATASSDGARWDVRTLQNGLSYAFSGHFRVDLSLKKCVEYGHLTHLSLQPW